MQQIILNKAISFTAIFLICGCSLGQFSVCAGPATGSAEKFPQQNDSTNPVRVFEQVWQLLDNNYPFFTQRGIDWGTIHKVFTGRVTETTTDEELYNILCEMLVIFNDGHINLENGKDRFCSGESEVMTDFKWKVVKDKYLKGSYSASQDSMIYYSWLTEDIAYMRIRRFPTKEVIEKYIDKIIAELIKAKGIIIDIRGNSGGNGFGVAALASRFADKRRLYLKNINRTGQKKEFTNATFHCIEPLGPVQYRGPVILLQNSHSESGAEGFALALRTLPNVTSIGEMTGGCLATYYPEKLLNGWSLTMPWSYTTDQDGFCWEGIGVPPNLRKKNTKEDIDAGNDKVLELAIELARAGGKSGKPPGGILVEAPFSLVDKYVETARAKGTTTAVTEFEALQKNEPGNYYFSIQELNLAVRKLFSEDKDEEARALLEFGRKSFPEDISTMYLLAKFYDQTGKPEKSKLLYKNITELKAHYPWEQSFVKEAEKAIK
ncbi:MAG: S41 family peptidase [bacterium]